MTFAAVGGTEIWYEQTGQGVPLVLVTGLGGTTAFWQKAGGLLGDRCRLITLDNRGAGRTKYAGPFTVPDLADDLAGLLDQLELCSAHVLGWSLGSHIALDFAARYPQRTRSLTLVAAYRYRPARAAYILDGLAREYAAGTASAATVGRTLNLLLHPEGYFARMEQEKKEVRLPPLPTPQGLLDQLRAVDGYDATAAARRLTVPTLSIHGTEDIMVEPREGDALADLIPGCTRLRVPGEGHVLRPEAYLPEAARFALAHQR